MFRLITVVCLTEEKNRSCKRGRHYQNVHPPHQHRKRNLDFTYREKFCCTYVHTYSSYYRSRGSKDLEHNMREVKNTHKNDRKKTLRILYLECIKFTSDSDSAILFINKPNATVW